MCNIGDVSISEVLVYYNKNDRKSQSFPKQHGTACSTFHIPSVLERLKCLRQSLHSLHPMRDSIHELIVDLEMTDSSLCNGKRIKMDTTDGSVACETMSCFQAPFTVLRNVMKAHKLHATILRHTLYEDPISSRNRNMGKIQLYRYVGDMLIVYFCMGHCASNIVEGTSEAKWLGSLMDKIEGFESKTRALGINDWYHLYICFHSSMLRTLPLLKSHFVKLGIATEDMVETMGTGQAYNGLSLIPHPVIFRGMKKKIIIERIGRYQEDCGVTSTIFDFGPLGPAFRGRDNVSFVHLTPVTEGVGGVIALEDLQEAMESHSSFDSRPDLTRLRQNTYEPVLVLARILKQSKKLHPINVELPLLTFYK